MPTRAKFHCESVTNLEYGGQTAKLRAVYGGKTNSEDNQFSEATPFGVLEMQVSNPAVKDFFTPGKDYYLDITQCQ